MDALGLFYTVVVCKVPQGLDRSLTLTPSGILGSWMHEIFGSRGHG